MPPGKNCGTHLCDGIASLDITPLIFSVSAVCSGFCASFSAVAITLHKFHFDFLRLCGLQFCECASFTAVRKFHRRVAHLSSLRACSKRGWGGVVGAFSIQKFNRSVFFGVFLWKKMTDNFQNKAGGQPMFGKRQQIHPISWVSASLTDVSNNVNAHGAGRGGR